jgi:colanic acid/amylovoran biosynthesis glycosyltransferase
MNVNEEKIYVHRMGIDLEKFQFQERMLQPGEPLKILTVGRLNEKKGHEYAIKGVAKLIKKKKNLIYTIAGDGPLGDKLANLVLDLGIDGNVKFLGPVDQKEVLKLYRESHIFLLTSVTAKNGDQEGIPVVLMEAQAMGLPIISTYHSGIPELVENGKSGFLVPEKDSIKLAEKLIYLAEKPELWSGMGTYGRKIVEEKYDIKKLNRKLVDIFHTVLKNHSAL